VDPRDGWSAGRLPKSRIWQLQGLAHWRCFVRIVMLALIRLGQPVLSPTSRLCSELVAAPSLPLFSGVMHFEKVVSAAWRDRRNPVTFRHAEVHHRCDRHDVHRHDVA